MTPVGVEQRIEAVPGVAAAAVVGVGPTGTQQLVAVVVPSAEAHEATHGSLADAGLTAAVRAAAGVPVAAVLLARDLPTDIRHNSKIDRAAVGPVGRPHPVRSAGRPVVKVLVTGASGMLGSATARALAARGDQVTVLQRRPAGLGLPEVLADVADPAAVRRAVAGQDAVVHLAAKVNITGAVAGLPAGQHPGHRRRGRRLPGGRRAATGARLLAVGRPRAGSRWSARRPEPPTRPAPGGRTPGARRERSSWRWRRTGPGWPWSPSGRIWSGDRATPS